jgi:hypothetical protein
MLALGLMLIVGNTMATVPPQPAELPLQYQLSEVTISILHQPGHGIPGGYELTISGDGSVSYLQTEGDKPIETNLQLSTEQLMELINRFYQIHFFELADTYSVTKEVVLKDKSTVATIATKMADSGSTRLCIQLGDYKKCVTIVNNRPEGAADIVKTMGDLLLK